MSVTIKNDPEVSIKISKDLRKAGVDHKWSGTVVELVGLSWTDSDKTAGLVSRYQLVLGGYLRRLLSSSRTVARAVSIAVGNSLIIGLLGRKEKLPGWLLSAGAVRDGWEEEKPPRTSFYSELRGLRKGGHAKQWCVRCGLSRVRRTEDGTMVRDVLTAVYGGYSPWDGVQAAEKEPAA
ncbi:hypothetical protein F2Q68_00009617 [Brassica cretica]|uniref:Uncharacterized protein n=1 Tax=Brassica cretica TaxID=69181 RepID=A0A8S9KTG7_BRACR|nr:hypothetical protein F2Q68_00009617 [Brassica cretica]